MRRQGTLWIGLLGTMMVIVAGALWAKSAVAQERLAEPIDAGQHPPRPFEQPPPLAAVPSPSDLAINARIKKQLFLDPVVSAAEVHVNTTAGVVHLWGTVRDLASKGRAGLIAMDTPGVASVINDLGVGGSTVPNDIYIQRDVLYALERMGFQEFRNVGVRVDSGVAFVTGTVDSDTMRDIAVRVVQGVPGVQTVKDDLHVASSTPPPDDQIRRNILQSFQREAFLTPGAIQVEVHNGQVRLSGAVADMTESQRAVQAAWIAGATSVDVSGLAILHPPLPEPVLVPVLYPSPADRGMEVMLDQALLRDPRLNTFPIRVNVLAQVVTLRGAVGNVAAKNLASALVWQVPGVRQVVNQLEVMPPRQIADEVTLTQVLAQLAPYPALRPPQVTASVAGGVVHLWGTVASRTESRLAERLARVAPGVTKVQNDLLVQPPMTARRPAPGPAIR